MPGQGVDSFVDLRAKPFNLDDEDVRWVETTLASMSDEEKVGQLFCLIGWSNDEKYLTDLRGTSGRVD